MFKICSITSAQYDILYEYDELAKMSEGIYLAILKPSKVDFEVILANVKQGKQEAIEEIYLLSPWLESPVDTLFDRSIIRYSSSSIPTEAIRELEILEMDILKEGNFYTYFYNKNMPPFVHNSGLYIIDVFNEQVKIYQTYF